MRQYAGFGTARETNRRFRQLLAAGQSGLSTAFDLPTQMGYDSDHPMAHGEVGRVGVAIDTVDDLADLFREIPLDRVSTSMTINATAAILLAMYVVVGEEHGVARTKLTGTVQNDVLKEYVARGTYIYPAGAVAPPGGGHLPLRRRRGDELQSRSRSAATTCGRRARRRCRRSGSPSPTRWSTCESRWRPGSRWTPSGRGSRSSSPATTICFEEAAKFRAARRLWARAGARAVRRRRRDGTAPLSHPDRRGHPPGAAAAQQRGAGDRAGTRGGAGRHPVAPYQRLRRGAGAPDGAVGDPRAPDPAGDRLRERDGGCGGPPGRQLLRRVAHRPDRSGGPRP